MDETPVGQPDSPVQTYPKTKRFPGRTASATLGSGPGAPNPVNGAVKQGPMAAKKVRRKRY